MKLSNKNIIPYFKATYISLFSVLFIIILYYSYTVSFSYLNSTQLIIVLLFTIGCIMYCYKKAKYFHFLL